MLRKLLSLVMWMLVVVTAQAVETPAVAPEIVNLAGEQRMLSQRVAKAYAQLGLEVLPAAALEQLRESILRFELNLERIRPAAAAVQDGERRFERLAAAWRELRAAADVPVSRESALEVALRGDRVLAAAEALTASLTRAGGERTARVSHAGRQRMLSQRLVKAFMLYSWGADPARSRREMEETMRDFDAGLAALSAMPDNPPAARQELEEIALQWEWLRTALEVEGAVSYRLIVAEAGESILEATERLTRIYEQDAAARLR